MLGKIARWQLTSAERDSFAVLHDLVNVLIYVCRLSGNLSFVDFRNSFADDV
jgi:hypothetical protein